MVDGEETYKLGDIHWRNKDLQRLGAQSNHCDDNKNVIGTAGRLGTESSNLRHRDAPCSNSSGPPIIRAESTRKMTTTAVPAETESETERDGRGSREFPAIAAPDGGPARSAAGADDEYDDDVLSGSSYSSRSPRRNDGGGRGRGRRPGPGPGLDSEDEPLLDLSTSSPTDVDHCHAAAGPGSGGGGPDTSANRRAQKQLIFAASVCFLFMVGEVIGGWMSHSLAIMTDAAHLLSDFTSFLISLFALWLARRPPTPKMSFGYLRAEILGAVISVLIIWIATGVLVYLAIQRCITRDYDIDAEVMLITASCGLGVNILLAVVLHFTGHSHSHGGMSHGHSHNHSRASTNSSSRDYGPYDSSSSCQSDYKPAVDSSSPLSIQAEPLLAAEVGSGDAEVGHARPRPSKSEVNMNVRAAFIHILGDLLQSVGVCIAAVIILVQPEWKLADPICTFTFSILVLVTTVVILRDAIQVLMEGVPRHINIHHLRSDMMSLSHVRMAHGLHVWSLTTSQAAMAVHLCIDAGEDAETVLQQASQLVRSKYNIIFSTIQVEHYLPEVMNNCGRCLESSH